MSHAHALDLTTHDSDTIRALREEIESLTVAARLQEELVLKGYQQMEQMLKQVEQQGREAREKSEEAERAQAYLDRVVDTMDEVLVVVGNDGRIKLINSRLLQLTGYKRDEMLGADPSKLFVREELQGLFAATSEKGRPGECGLEGEGLLRMLSQLRGAQLDGHLLGKGGEKLAHLFRWSNLYSAKGKKEGVVIVGADVRRLRFTLSALERAHREMRLVFDSVDQGLLTLNMAGVIGEQRSARVEQWFGEITAGARLWEYLGARDAEFGLGLELGWESVQEDLLPVEMSLEQLPSRITLGGSTYDLTYSPLYENGALSGAFVVISDVTMELRHALESKRRAEFFEILDHINRDRVGFSEFLADTGALVTRLMGEDGYREEGGGAVLLRDLHTVKGNSALFGVHSVEEVCHTLEDTLKEENRDRLRSAERAELEQVWQALTQSIGALLGSGERVALLDMAQYQQLLTMLEKAGTPPEVRRHAQRLGIETTESRLHRLGEQAIALAKRVGKGVQVSVEAIDERFPTDTWAPFWSVFVHVLRNAVDHGIETPEVRRELGKPEEGVLTLRAFRKGDQVMVELQDDGSGIDWDKVRARAREKGLPCDTEEQLQALILQDGFSTRDSATLLSGRGVGMGSVSALTREMGGAVMIETQRGAGTTMRFVFPDTLIV